MQVRRSLRLQEQGALLNRDTNAYSYVSVWPWNMYTHWCYLSLSLTKECSKWLSCLVPVMDATIVLQYLCHDTSQDPTRYHERSHAHSTNLTFSRVALRLPARYAGRQCSLYPCRCFRRSLRNLKIYPGIWNEKSLRIRMKN